MADTPAPDTIVLIHGFWVTPRSWENWKQRYEERGFRVLTPTYPGFEGEVEALNADPTPIAEVTLAAIVDHLAAVIQGWTGRRSWWATRPAAPSCSSCSTAATARSASPSTPRRPRASGSLPLSQLRSTFPVLKNPANRHRAVGFSPEQWHYAFTNTFTEEESRRCTSAMRSRRPAGSCGAACWPTSCPARRTPAVDYGNDAAPPLLFISGGEDHIMPPSVQRSNAKHYKGDTVTEVKEYAGYAHLLPAQEGWEEIADYALEWALSHADGRRSRAPAGAP